MILETGTILNNIYRVVKLLGKGSMGNVYLVERIKYDKKFVVKELNFSQEAGLDISTAKEIFHREAEFMAKINHPGVPKMYGVFPLDGKDYLTMDYIEGKTLEEIINTSEGPISKENAIKWTVEIADILNYLHNSFHQPIVYRDLKPSNIIIKPDGNPVLVDFGIARYYNPDKEQDTFNYGSPGYAAPEQYKGKGRSTPQTDVFALGVILFQMVTRYDPSLKPLTFPSMRSLNDNISKELEVIVKRAIELNPLKRYISVQEFKEKLAKYANMSIEDEKPQKNPNKWAIRSKKLAFIAGVIPVIIILLAIANANLIMKHETAVKIFSTVIWILLIIMYLCPVAGIITGIIASWKARKDIYCEPAGDGMGCNIIITVVFIIISCMIIPNFLKAKVSGELCGCEINIKNIATALELYAEDNNNKYPADLNILVKEKGGVPYIKTIPVCPAGSGDIFPLISRRTYSAYEYKTSHNGNNFTIWCVNNHVSAGTAGGYPQYSPGQGLIPNRD